MAGKIYREKTSYSPAMDSESISKDYDEQISILANCIDKLEGVKGRFEYLREITDDNGDPAFELMDAFPKLAVALAAAITYRDEYRKEAFGEYGEPKEPEEP